MIIKILKKMNKKKKIQMKKFQYTNKTNVRANKVFCKNCKLFKAKEFSVSGEFINGFKYTEFSIDNKKIRLPSYKYESVFFLIFPRIIIPYVFKKKLNVFQSSPEKNKKDKEKNSGTSSIK